MLWAATARPNVRSLNRFISYKQSCPLKGIPFGGQLFVPANDSAGFRRRVLGKESKMVGTILVSNGYPHRNVECHTQAQIRVSSSTAGLQHVIQFRNVFLCPDWCSPSFFTLIKKSTGSVSADFLYSFTLHTAGCRLADDTLHRCTSSTSGRCRTGTARCGRFYGLCAFPVPYGRPLFPLRRRQQSGP